MDSSASITQTLLLVVLFVAAIASLPWLIRKLQQRQAGLMQGATGVSRVVAAVSVGPQQRVVTVEVGPPRARQQLVLGVTAQQITCLQVLPLGDPARDAAGAAAAPVPASFAQALDVVATPVQQERSGG